jgi:regulator of sigma E protease
MLAILAPILVFGLVIFVHELGHFIAAKATGVYAPRFSIGFGPPIFKWRRGETEYVLAWLPLGGYVRMASRHDAETAFLEGGNEESTAREATDADFDPNAMIPFGPKPVPEDRWFESKSLTARIVIMIAGVVMNAILAVIVGAALAAKYGEAVVYQQPVIPTTVVGTVRATDSTALLRQIHPGDTIHAVNGHAVRNWNDVAETILGSEGSVSFETNRGAVDIPLKGAYRPEVVAASVRYLLSPVIDTVFAGDPAAMAGLQRGDSITSASGKPVLTWSEVVDEVSHSPGKPVALVVTRAGQPVNLTVTPKAVPDTDAVGTVDTVGRIGAGIRSPVQRGAGGVGEALAIGLKLTKKNGGAVFKILHGIGTGAVSVRELGGPVAITRASVAAARSGLADLFYLISLLSINVAILNLLPIPILDGGQILINVLETVKGKPFSLRTREYILRFGLLAIGLLFAIVMYNDLHAGVAKLFGWVGRLFGA